MSEVFTAADGFLEEGDSYWHFDIDVDDHMAAIQCYGKSKKAAKAMRDRILAALRNPK